MLPIIGLSVPPSPAALEEALKAGFGCYGIEPKSVSVQGAALSELESLAVDLTNANISRSVQMPKPGPVGETVALARAFSLKANPLLLEGIPASLDVTAADVALGLSTDDRNGMLVPTNARDGSIVVEIDRGNLEKLLEKAASEAASKQGVEIRETHLELTSKSDRAMSFRADVVGKVFVMKAPVSLTGDLAIDDDLNLHLSNLAVGGSGMLANLANSFAQPHLKKLEAQPIALGVIALGSLKLRDIRLQGGNSLRLEARFGA
jgi:hypothetical protein